MKKGLTNKKLVYAGLDMALAAVVCTGGFTATKTKSQAGSNGTERDWSLHLPHEN